MTIVTVFLSNQPIAAAQFQDMQFKVVQVIASVLFLIAQTMATPTPEPRPCRFTFHGLGLRVKN